MGYIENKKINIDLESIKNMYNELKSPVLICDLNFNVFWVNGFASKNVKEINSVRNIKAIFPAYDFDSIKNFLVNGSTYQTNEIMFGISSISLFFVPIFDNQGIFGATVFLKDSKVPGISYNTDVNKIVSTVSAQFRSPLFNIFNLLSPISHRLEEHELYDDIEYVRHISKNCYKMIKSTVNLSEYFKLTLSNSYNLKLGHVNMNMFIENLCKSIQIIFTSLNDISLEYHVTKENIISNIDHEKFSIAFFNIIANSCMYTSPGNVIKVSLEKINNDAIITISDKGAGIDPNNLDKVFEPYFSHDPSGDSFSYKGVGLGLTIVKMIVEAHKGSYILNSTPNEGTTIAIKIPTDDNIDILPYFESNTANYIANKFSPLYIFLADLCDFNSLY